MSEFSSGTPNCIALEAEVYLGLQGFPDRVQGGGFGERQYNAALALAELYLLQDPEGGNE